MCLYVKAMLCSNDSNVIDKSLVGLCLDNHTHDLLLVLDFKTYFSWPNMYVKNNHFGIN